MSSLIDRPDYSTFPPELQELFKVHPDTEIDPQCDDANIKLFFRYFAEYFRAVCILNSGF